MQTHGLRDTLMYGTPGNGSIQTGHIYDITDDYDSSKNRHFEYDRWYRLIWYKVSPGRNDPVDARLLWTYDGYNNLASVRFYDPGNCYPEGCSDVYGIDAASNRLNSIVHNTTGQWVSYYSFDATGNDISGGKTYDGENRLSYAPVESYLYDGNSRRMRKVKGTTKVFYVYSATGRLLVEDNWSDGTARNQIYFNGQLVATHDQADYVRFYFKDYLGSVRSVVEVSPGGGDWTTNWMTVEVNSYSPYGYEQFNIGAMVSYEYTGKPLDSTGLQYYGARYYQSGYARWISADPISSRIYDPPSLNKYAYVRNDPVNWIDPDGRMAAPLDRQLLVPFTFTFWNFSENEGVINGVLLYSYTVFSYGVKRRLRSM
jgi:RHS repeat-associated protein